MPKPPKPISDVDQSKAGLQDDHDPRDPAQQQNEKPKGDYKTPKQPAGPYERTTSLRPAMKASSANMLNY